MVALLFFLLRLLASLFRSTSRLEAENAALKHQLIVVKRKVRGRVEFTNSDRLFFIQLYRWFPSILKVVTIMRPETLVRWHRAGFRRYWRWKSRNLGGRPPIDAGLRALIRRMSIENWLWGAPRIHGELLKLGFAVAQSTVAKYMARLDGSPPGQRWGTFVRNHMPHVAAMDLFVVPTFGFNLLYVLVIVRLARRELVWINVTSHPTAEWIAQQIPDAGNHPLIGSRAPVSLDQLVNVIAALAGAHKKVDCIGPLRPRGGQIRYAGTASRHKPAGIKPAVFRSRGLCHFFIKLAEPEPRGFICLQRLEKIGGESPCRLQRTIDSELMNAWSL